MRNKKILAVCAGLLCLALLALCSVAAAEEYRTLKSGMEGKDVLKFKQAMYWLGYFTTEKLSDQYNGTTVERVKMLQKNNGLEETGIADAALQELVFSGRAVKTDTAPAPSPIPTPAPTPVPPREPVKTPDLPPLTAEGFLAEDAGMEEYVYVDAEDGRWIYITSSLSIDLKRYTDATNKNEWFEGNIHCSPETPLTAYLTQGKIYQGKAYTNPLTLARENRVVLGISDDHFGDRWNGDIRTGVIVRNGEIITERTFPADHPAFPNLEILAVFEDGSMKTFKSDAHTGQEYLDMGVVNTYSFGPILVSGGQVSEYMLREEYYTYREPRCALGMIEPWHYFLLVAKGRDGVNSGVYLTWLADKMMEKGVVEGMNLDGGGTTALMFMGEMLNKSTRNVRSVTSITGFGNSTQVRAK